VLPYGLLILTVLLELLYGHRRIKPIAYEPIATASWASVISKKLRTQASGYYLTDCTMNHNAYARMYLAAVLMGISSCSSYDLTYTPNPKPGTQEYRDSLRVLLQVCVPTPFTSKYLGGWIIHRYGEHGELRSALSIRGEKLTYSSTGQPIFEIFTHERQIDLVALTVKVEGVEYVFGPGDQKLPTDAWTIWLPPVTKDARGMAWYSLANQHAVPVAPPEPTAPKVRFRLVRTSDWWRKVPLSNNESPGC